MSSNDDQGPSSARVVLLLLVLVGAGAIGVVRWRMIHRDVTTTIRADDPDRSRIIPAENGNEIERTGMVDASVSRYQWPDGSAHERTVRDRAQYEEARRRIVAGWTAAAAARDPSMTGGLDGGIPEPVSSLDPSYIRSMIRDEFLPMARDCYDQALHRSEHARGRVSVTFVIMADEHVGGVVDDVQLADVDASDWDDAFRTCLRETMRTMVFRAPDGGGRVTVRYPFTFTPEEPDR